MAVVDVEFRANANFSGLISQANMANAAISKLQASVTSLNAEQINQAFAEFSRGLTGSGQYIAQTVRVSDATQRFGQDLVNNKLQLKDYAREFGNYVAGRESQIKKLADQQVRLQRSMVVTRGTDSTGRLVAQVFTPTGLSNDLETNAMRATSRIQVMNEFLHKASTAVVNWGKNTQWAGRQMTVGLTVPLSMLATATGKAFYELDTQLIQMQKVYGTGIKGVGDEAIASIRSQVTQLSQELAKAYGIPVAQTAALAAEIAQAGKTGNELLASVEQTTKLATLGEIDRQDAMKATLSIQSTFNQNTQELSDSINFLNSVENATNVSLQDLVTGIPKAGPVVKALGGDIKDLSLMMVAMKEGGIPASEAANAIKSSLASLINPTEKVTEKMKTFGIDLVSIVDKNAGQLMPTLMEFRGELNKLDDLSRQRILEELFGKFQFARVNALFNNLGRAGSQTVQVMELMGLSTAELASIADKELKTMAESASGRFKRLWATVQGDLAVAGQGVLNAGSVILSVISKIINGFEQLPDGLKKFLGGTALLAAVIGPIIMTIGVLGNFFGYIMKGLALMRSFGRRGAGDFQLMTAETVAMANAGSILENTLFDQAKAADLMRTSIEKLTMSLSEMGTVSSTASKAVESAMVGAQGRAAAAATAVGVGGHMLPAETIRDFGLFAPENKKGKRSEIEVMRGGVVALQEDVNAKMGATPLGMSGAPQFGISSKQMLEHTSANRALFDVFNKDNKKSLEHMTSIAKILTDDSISLEERFNMLETQLKIKNPAQLYSDFLKRTSDLATQESKILDNIMKLEGKELNKEFGNAQRKARSQFVQGKGDTAVTYDQFIKAYKDYINEQGISEEERTRRTRDATMQLRQIDKRYGQTLQTGGRGLGADPGVAGSRALSATTGLVGSANYLSASVAGSLVAQEAIIKRQITATFAMKRQQAIATGQSVKNLDLALRKILTDANLTIEQKAAQIAAYNVGNVPGAGVPLSTPVGGKQTSKKGKLPLPRGSGMGGSGLMGAGMALSMGSMFLPAGGAQNAAFMAGNALTMANFIPDTVFKSITGKLTGIKGGLTSVVSVGSKLRLLGPLIFNPWVAGAVAVGAAAIFVKNRLDDAAEKNRSWMSTSKSDADVLGFKYVDLKQKVEDVSKGMDKAASATKKLVDEINKSSDDNPLKRLAEDISNDRSTEDSVNKMVTFFQKQLTLGVDPKIISTQIDAALQIAGKSELSIPIKLRTDKINVDDFKNNLKDVIGQFDLGDAGEVEKMAIYLRQAIGDINTVSPEKWQQFTSALNDSAGYADLSGRALSNFNDQLIESFSLQGEWKVTAMLAESAADAFNIVALALGNIPPAASAAGRSAQVAATQAADAAAAAAGSNDRSFVSKFVKRTSGSGSRSASGGGGGGGDPYKAQKDANQERIDDEQKIIKAIEKKRDAEKKAFDEKKKQNEYLNKQADLQIGYREALATGDFAAAAMMKNEILAAQAAKKAEDAQQKKDDKYQRAIDGHQAEIEKLQDKNKALDKLSEKAKSVSTSVAASSLDTYNSTVNRGTEILGTLTEYARTHGITNVNQLIANNKGAVAELEKLGLPVKSIMAEAINNSTAAFNGAAGKLTGAAASIKSRILGILTTEAQITALIGWYADNRDATPAQILAKAEELRTQAKPKPTPTEPPRIPVGQPGSTATGAGSGFGPLSDSGNEPGTHSGGPIGPGMGSSMFGKSLRGPIANDERFILAQDGEYMISAAAAGIIGRSNLDAINNGKLPAVPVSGGSSGSSNVFNVYATPGQDAKQIAQEVHRIFQINERRKGGART